MTARIEGAAWVVILAALTAMWTTMPTQVGLVLACGWRVVELTWLPVVIVAGIACMAAVIGGRR